MIPTTKWESLGDGHEVCFTFFSQKALQLRSIQDQPPSALVINAQMAARYRLKVTFGPWKRSADFQYWVSDILTSMTVG